MVWCFLDFSDLGRVKIICEGSDASYFLKIIDVSLNRIRKKIKNLISHETTHKDVNKE